MTFNSYVFILAFLPITLIGYYISNKFEKYKLGLGVLLIASLIFYGYFNIKYLLLIAISVCTNYFVYKGIQSVNKNDHGERNTKVLLAIGIAFNLGLIAYFKYLDFFISNINAIFGKSIPLMNILLPLGISFFTFQQISFLIDVSKNGGIEYTLLEYATYVTFFPQLVAGPIVTHDVLIPQLKDKDRKRYNEGNMLKGTFIFGLGLSKKSTHCGQFWQLCKCSI